MQQIRKAQAPIRRGLIDRFFDWKNFPATTTLVSVWVLIYVAMFLMRNPTMAPGGGLIGPGGIDTATAWRFGDATADSIIRGGQFWRAETAAFIHFSVLHLGMNLLALVQLGQLVESMYGPGLLLLLTTLIALFSNIFAALSRIALNDSPGSHFGGGSSVIMGFVGLLAVVGWRSKTATGQFIARQMATATTFIILMGLALPVVDNYGHVCGLLVGGVIGLAHRRILHMADVARVGRYAASAVVVFLTCVGLQFSVSSRPLPVIAHAQVNAQLSAQQDKQAQTLLLTTMLYAKYAQQAATPLHSFAPIETLPPLTLLRRSSTEKIPIPTKILRDILRSTLPEWDTTLSASLQASNSQADPTFDRARLLLGRAISKPPTPQEAREFLGLVNLLLVRTNSGLGSIPIRIPKSARPASKGPASAAPAKS